MSVFAFGVFDPLIFDVLVDEEEAGGIWGSLPVGDYTLEVRVVPTSEGIRRILITPVGDVSRDAQSFSTTDSDRDSSALPVGEVPRESNTLN